MQTNYPYYATIIIKPEDYTNLFQGDMSLTDKKRLQLVHLIIQNMADELLGAQYSYLSQTIDKNTVYIINFSEAPKKLFYSVIDEIFETINNVLASNFDFFVITGCSTITDNPEQIYNCYSQALLALEQYLVGNDHLVQQYREPSEENVTYYFPLEREQQLLNSLKAGDREAAENILELLLRVNLEAAKSTSPQIVRLLLYDITCCILKLAPIQETEIHGLLDKITSGTNWHEVKKDLSTIIQTICSASSSAKSGTNSLIAQRAIHFAATHYEDPNLSVGMIADTLGITAAHLSRVFKLQTSGTLLEYIQQLRVSKAAQLLQSGLSVEETARQTGFTNSNTFSRVFKKLEGQSPAQYRNQNFLDI